MLKKHLYGQNEAEELEELEDDPELKELGNEDLEETEDLKSAEDNDVLEEGKEMPETE